ncbi:biotin/lipoyl-containing protein [Dermatophilus congolensis]|uniref:Methylmalonyl-CoA carboxyltransferase 1.3S subunit n=2 Tax=Dermatophilus congolensis TaxID=1863 RepID=A0A239VJ03_9MICO|nr:biotin/lipoyl-containing protein [Dermatophilus congolensis]MBO3129079.1 biotin/lipoyl-binding protein [Dermatophilus congolensis]MBO3132284.1 biotin/lipoyl-binding protein [Dermatophilus congolensis]MBO3133555.1 biotin/lipoyl-binding protein [Dermatophilus congolensis]MBO3135788.1 biotin/lipoyl-binding protein [Dermatophilus congolensis]MBO3138030.1 biotin/lipoyl-binding protein [Dermatophilus congolensis]
MKLKITVNGSVYDVEVEVEDTRKQKQLGAIQVGGFGGGIPATSAVKAPASSASALTANIAGTVVKVLVEDGAEVKSGDTLLILEAMKMETEVTAPKDGVVASVEVTVGQAVQNGQVLLQWAES